MSLFQHDTSRQALVCPAPDGSDRLIGFAVNGLSAAGWGPVAELDRALRTALPRMGGPILVAPDRAVARAMAAQGRR